MAVQRLSPAFMRKRVDEIQSTHCTAEVVRLRRDYAVSTVRASYGVYHSIFTVAVRDKVIADNPWTHVEVDAAKPRLRITTADEDAELLGALADYHGRWYRVLRWTGLRISELTGLTPRHLHWVDAYMQVKGKGSKRHRGGKWRDVPMAPEVADLLRAQIAERGISQRPQAPLWIETSEMFQKQLRKRSADLGIPLVTPHALRHSFATHYLACGGNIYYLSKILGHASVTITEKTYVHETKEHIFADYRRVLQKMAPAAQAVESIASTQMPNGSATTWQMGV